MFSQFPRAFLVLMFLAVGTFVVAAEPTKDSLEKVKKNLEDKKAVLLDVRERDEWDDGHLELAIHLPLSQIEKGISAKELEKLAPKDAIIYLHCAAGARSLQAAELLEKHERDLRPLKPGYSAILKAGFKKADK